MSALRFRNTVVLNMVLFMSATETSEKAGQDHIHKKKIKGSETFFTRIHLFHNDYVHYS